VIHNTPIEIQGQFHVMILENYRHVNQLPLEAAMLISAEVSMMQCGLSQSK
jgi:hypothetical protein